MYEDISSKKIKKCIKCGQFKSHEYFIDNSLKSKISKICSGCRPKRNTKKTNYKRRATTSNSDGTKTCRVCNASLVIGQNWTQSRKEKWDYICRYCNSSSPTKRKKTKKVNATSSRKTMRIQYTNCPKCGSSLVLRTNRKTGETFYGCSKFPVCRGTRQVL